MKLEVKEGLRQLAFPETTMMSDGRVKNTINPKIKKDVRLGKTSLNPLPPPSRYPKPKVIPVMRSIDYMPRFTLPFIEKMVDVIDD
ncbi:hypothetical protein MTR_8g103765 [Medicago truncatula]|uniref:Uncharacterized protein n=1 Tax=Medicago truncatula TaxID=3880 RepID=A0A072TX00_MEDTR|nr:hypothetical protein MTR_8g103765 [Medicago truncatula]